MCQVAVAKVLRTIKSCKHPTHLRVCQNWIENLEKSGKINQEEVKELVQTIDTHTEAEALRDSFEVTLQ